MKPFHEGHAALAPPMQSRPSKPLQPCFALALLLISLWLQEETGRNRTAPNKTSSWEQPCLGRNGKGKTKARIFFLEESSCAEGNFSCTGNKKKGHGYACASCPAACSIQSPAPALHKALPLCSHYSVKHLPFPSHITYKSSTVTKLHFQGEK